jgi:RNA polymerase sigma-70 factor (ECF subfamily)
MSTVAAPIVARVKPIVRSRERSLDPESRRWLEELSADGPLREEAVGRLHALLLRAARFEVMRRGATSPELDELAEEAAGDAVLSVLRRLDDFRGQSRFTTWAYKFALLEAAVKMRKRAWQGREIPLDYETWSLLPSDDAEPPAEAEQAELLATVQQGIGECLTPHQRRVLLALAVDGVPIDVLAEKLDSNRGALYKTLHDARRKLRAYVEEAQ